MSRQSEPAIPVPRLPPERAEEVLAELERVLASHLFKGSRRCQVLLRHITEKTLVGDSAALKERTLGISVFGREPDYDTSQDPIVRASAAEIRKKLAQFYQEPGHESAVHIELLSGSYIAEFHFTETAVEAPPVLPRRRRWPWIAGAAAAVAALALSTILLALPRWRASDLDQLWGPLLKTPGPVLICVGQPAVYNLRSAEAQDEIQGLIAHKPQTGKPVAHRMIPEDDLIVLRDRYVALDDAFCMVRMAALLERYRKPYTVRGERSTSFADLRDTPVVLIGAWDNPWTLRIAGRLRFTFMKDAVHDTNMVHDRQHPESVEWKLTGAWPNWDVPYDYAIVTRILDTTTDRPLIAAAGMTQAGTIGAGEFLSNAAYFAEAARKLPRDWAKRNLQVVLKVPVENRISGHPQILAYYVW
jgi:hypothetical protein